MAGPADEPVELSVEAATVDWDAGQVYAGGPGGVDVTWGGLAGPHLHALEVAGSLDDLRVQAGVLTLSVGTVTFGAGLLTPSTQAARLTGVRLFSAASCGAAGSGEAPPLLVSESVEIDGDGHWHAVEATLQPCACPTGTPLLSLHARRIDLVPDRYAVLRGGTIRLLGVPLIPVPWWRVALAPDAFRLSLPQVGYGEAGWSASVTGSGGVEGWRLQGGPAWREDRGVRVVGGASGAPGAVRGEAGWDEATGGMRGVLAGQGGVAASTPISSRLAWDLDAPTDLAYVEDYGLDYVDRGAAWRDSRILGAYGPLQATASLANDGSRIDVVGIRARAAFGPAFAARGPDGQSRGPTDGALTVAPSVSGGLVAASSLGGNLGAPILAAVVPRLGAGLEVNGARTRGLLHVETDAHGDVWMFPTSGSFGAVGSAEGFVAMPMWSAVGEHHVQWWPGAYAEVSAGTGASVSGAPVGGASVEGAEISESPLPTVDAGPALRADTSVGAWFGAADLRALWGLGGFRPSVSLFGSAASFQGRLHADLEVQSGEVAARAPLGPVELRPRIGSAHTADLWLGWGGLEVAWRGWSAGGTASGDLGGGASAAADETSGGAADEASASGDEAGAGANGAGGAGIWTGGTAFIGYTDGCDSLRVNAVFAEDRALPDIGLTLTLRR